MMEPLQKRAGPFAGFPPRDFSQFLRPHHLRQHPLVSSPGIIVSRWGCMSARGSGRTGHPLGVKVRCGRKTSSVMVQSRLEMSPVNRDPPLPSRQKEVIHGQSAQTWPRNLFAHFLKSPLDERDGRRAAVLFASGAVTERAEGQGGAEMQGMTDLEGHIAETRRLC